MNLKDILIASLLLVNFSSISQESNYLTFKIMSLGKHKPIMAATLSVQDSILNLSYQNFTDRNGFVCFDVSILKSDSSFLSVRVAMDTLITMKIYKNKVYNYEIKLFVDTEAIKKKNEEMQIKRRKKNQI